MADQNSPTDKNRTDASVPEHHMNSKVGRIITEYELTGLGTELEYYWTTSNENRYSLRQLADLFNRRVLRSTMETAGMNPLDGEVKNTYRLLTDTEVSAGVQTQAENTLEQHDIDVDQLTQDFVSHQAVHTYLTRYRNVDRPSETQSSEDHVENGLQAIQRLTSRLQAVTTKTLRTLQNTDRITLGTFTVLVDVRVFCEECETQYDVSELLTQHGCECEQRGM